MASKKQETVVVQDYPNKMGYVQAQPHTHFRLTHKSDRKKLLQIIDSISDVSGPIVASYDYGRKYNTDIIIRRRGSKAEPIGKIHLLLFDKPNRYDHDKYYIKLHFFQFVNDTLFDSVKEKVSSFFQSLPPTSESYLKNSTRKNESVNQSKPRRTIKNSLTLRTVEDMKIDAAKQEMKE